MGKIFIIAIFLLQVVAQESKGQEDPGELLSSIILNYLPEETGEESVSEILNELSWFFSTKPDINELEAGDLKKLIFLNDFQVFTILEYREKYGMILSLKEMVLVPGLSGTEIELLDNFLSAGTGTNVDNPVITKGKAGFRLLNRFRYDSPLREGFRLKNDSLRSFSGPPLQRIVKGELQLNRGISAGFCMESDPGEKMTFSDAWDFCSAYYRIYRPGKTISDIIIGDYRINSGTGLVHGSGIGSKSSSPILKEKFNTLKKYSSTAESGFMRGLSLRVEKTRLKIVVFYSRTGLSGHTGDQGQISAIDISGLHRNQEELEIKDKNWLDRAGTVSSLRINKLLLTYSLDIRNYSDPLEIRELPDRYSRSRTDRNFSNQSLSFSYRNGRLLSFGEIAVDGKMAPAGIGVLNLDLHPLYRISLSGRYYSPGYYSPYSSVFSERSGSRNEKGLYLGMEMYPFRILKLSFYLDWYKFPWLGYSDSSPGMGTDFLINADWKLSSQFDITTLLKIECKTAALNEKENIMAVMEAVNTTRFYIRSMYLYSERIKLSNKLELRGLRDPGRSLYGMLLYQQMSLKSRDEKFSIDARYTIFDIPDWELRIYNWEPDLSHSFSMPAYYRSGQSFLINLKYKLERLSIGFKYASTDYGGDIESGSGPDLRKGTIFRTYKFQWVLKI